MIEQLNSKKDIDRLGDLIRLEVNPSQKSLEALQLYRVSHKDSLALIFNVLCKEARRIDSNAIVTYRIKRFESIIGKLKRYPKMQFNRMWDIGGCRCIMKNDEAVYRLKARLEKKINVRKIYDYIKNPQPEGYRSLHLFANVNESDKIIEIQIRNQEDHNWATLVEITDILFDSKLKEYQKDKQLLDFHQLLSQYKTLNLKDGKKFANILEARKYFEVLGSVFSKNHLEVRQQWIELEAKQSHKYFLIEVRQNEIPQIISFPNFEAAEKEYFQKYLSNQNANIVLTHLPKASYSQISVAYSNYILTYHDFTNECNQILGRLIVDAAENHELRLLFYFYKIYYSIYYVNIKNIVDETRKLLSYIKQPNKAYKKSFKEWVADFKKQIQINNNQSKDLHDAINLKLSKSKIKKIISLGLQISVMKYLMKINKENRRLFS